MTDKSQVEELGDDYLVEDTVKPEETKEPETEAKVQETNLPPQYAEKSIEDLIEMNMEAQKQISRQGNEIGELRKFTDSYLQESLSKDVTKEPETYDFDEAEDVIKHVDKIVDSKVKEVEDRVNEVERQRLLEQFSSKHPDWQKEANSSKFLNWVAESPFRTRMYKAADNMDFAAADDLFTEWETQKQTSSSEEDETRQEQLKAASMETSGSPGTTKKIYSRAALIKMKNEDPEKYRKHSKEIFQAYADKRVR